MLTLRPAFRGDDQLQLIRRIENEPPVPPRQLERGIPRGPRDDRAEGPRQGPGRPVRQRRGDGRRIAAVRGEPADPLAADPGRPAVLAVVPRNPWLAAANITAAFLTTVLAIVSTFAAWSYREQRNADRHDLTRSGIGYAETRVRTGPRRALQALARPRQAGSAGSWASGSIA